MPTYKPTRPTWSESVSNSHKNQRPTKGWQAPKFEMPKPLFNKNGSYR